MTREETNFAQATGALTGPAELPRQVKDYEVALKDIVALAYGVGVPRQRVIQMQRRALAALSGADRPRLALRDYAPLHPVTAREAAQPEPSRISRGGGCASNAPELEAHES